MHQNQRKGADARYAKNKLLFCLPDTFTIKSIFKYTRSPKVFNQRDNKITGRRISSR